MSHHLWHCTLWMEQPSRGLHLQSNKRQITFLCVCVCVVVTGLEDEPGFEDTARGNGWLSRLRCLFNDHRQYKGALGSPWASSICIRCVSLPLPCFWSVASFIGAPGLPPPSRQVSPIPLIAGKVQVLSVASWWVGVVYPVLHDPPGSFRPRFQGWDATVCLCVCACVCVSMRACVCVSEAVLSSPEFLKGLFWV